MFFYRKLKIFQFNDYIQPICISSSMIDDDNVATLIGFGKSSVTETRDNLNSKSAKKLLVPLVSKNLCNQPHIMNDQILQGTVEFCKGRPIFSNKPSP